MDDLEPQDVDPLSEEEAEQFDIELSETDRGIVNHLRFRTCTPAFIAESLDIDQSYVRQRLSRLVEHGYVTRVHHGLYEPVRCDRCEEFALPHFDVVTNRLPPMPMEQVDPGEETPEGETDLVQFKLCSQCHGEWENKPWDVQHEMLEEISYEGL